MTNVLIVGAGGFLGAIVRYKLGGWVLHFAGQGKFPLSTFVVNSLGCFIAGILAALVERHDAFSPSVRLFLFTGLLGGFTTFSAFGLETFYLLQRHEFIFAGLNILLSVLAGILALWIGVKILN